MKFQTKYLKNFEKELEYFCSIQSKRLLIKEDILCHTKQAMQKVK